MRLIFLGPPGAGKGTQAATLAQQWQVPHISTGDILRQAIADQTALGVQAKAQVDAGELVSDELIVALMRQRLAQPDALSSWILDGFPRNLAQALALDQLLQILGQSCNEVVYFDVSNEALVQRMLGRGRHDDNEATIRRRLEVYQDQTAALINFYQRRQCLKVIDGNKAVHEVTSSLQAWLKPEAKV